MWNRRKTGKRLDRELARLRHEFETIYDRMQVLRPAIRTEKSVLGSVAPWFEQGFSRPAPGAVREMTRAASRGAEQVSHQLEDVFDMAAKAVRQRPVPAGLVLLAIGVVLGLATRKALAN